jgi:uncharacterized protein
MGGDVAVKCPTCRRKGDWLAGKYGVFCSHRCKLIDLGKWLGGEHVISEPLSADHLEAAKELQAPGNADDADEK